MDTDKENLDFDTWYTQFLKTEYKKSVNGWSQKEIAQAAFQAGVKKEQSKQDKTIDQPVVVWLHPTDPTRAVTKAQKEGAIKDGGAIASSMEVYSVPGYLTPLPGPTGELNREPAAWLHSDDPMRVITKAQKDGAIKDGGAIKSAMEACTIPCYTKTKINYLEDKTVQNHESRVDNLLKELKLVLLKYNAGISWTCSPDSDTHGLHDDSIVIEMDDIEIFRSGSWYINSDSF